MQIRCYRCGFSFALSRETIAAALANLTVTGNSHHIEHCPRCRSANKIPRQLLTRFALPVTEEALAAARAALEATPAEPVKQIPFRAPVTEPEAEKKKNKHHRRRSAGGDSVPVPMELAPAPTAVTPPPAPKPMAVTVAETPSAKSEKPAVTKPAAKTAKTASGKATVKKAATKTAKPASAKTATKKK